MKSDDVTGRLKTYEAIIKGENIPAPGIPESFKVLLKGLQSLGLDVKVLKDDNTEVHLLESVDYGDTDLRSVIEGDSRRPVSYTHLKTNLVTIRKSPSTRMLKSYRIK